MKKSVILAFLIFLGILAYFGARTLLRDDSAAVALEAKGAQSVQEVTEAQTNQTPEVVTTQLTSELHPVYLVLKGRTAPNRTVIVRSATTGNIVDAPQVEGRTVRKGQLLCRLDVASRQARIAEAEALLAAQQQEFDAASRLVEKGLSPKNRVTTAKANLDAAAAALNAAKIELSRTEIRAPFSGVFEERMAELGDFLSPGGACGQLTDLNPIKVEADITEDYALTLEQGAEVQVSVLNGEPLQGSISYVARTSDDATRTFKIEASLPNPNGKISAGLTSDIRIELNQTEATLLSPGLLTLHDDGRLGVRYVSDEGVVIFAEVTIIDDTSEGVWVTGLPDNVPVISIGQEFIGEGAKVKIAGTGQP